MLYLAFGDIDQSGLSKELLCSLMSFQKVSSEASKRNTQIVIYSGNPVSLPDSLNDISIVIHPLSEADVAESIKKTNGFVLALKVSVLLKFFQTIKKGNVLFVDTDTFFIKDPQPLFESIENGDLIMHVKEHKIKHRPALRGYLAGKIFKDSRGNSFTIDSDTDLWNTGVVGMNQSFAPELDAVHLLIEQLAVDVNFHILEQLSFSYVLQKNGRILPADPYVVHYYFFKSFVHVLGRYFHFTINEDTELLDKLRRATILPEQIVYADLSKILINSLKSSFVEWIFFCLPPNSHIGKILVHEFLYDRKFYDKVIYVFIKRIFNTYKLWEYNLSEKLKSRY